MLSSSQPQMEIGCLTRSQWHGMSLVSAGTSPLWLSQFAILTIWHLIERVSLIFSLLIYSWDIPLHLRIHSESLRNSGSSDVRRNTSAWNPSCCCSRFDDRARPKAMESRRLEFAT